MFRVRIGLVLLFFAYSSKGDAWRNSDQDDDDIFGIERFVFRETDRILQVFDRIRNLVKLFEEERLRVEDAKRVQDVKQFFNEYWNWRLLDSPELATILGNFAYDDRIGDMSIKSFKGQATKLRGFLKRLLNLKRFICPKKHPDLSLNIRLLENEFKQYISGVQYHTYVWPMDQLSGPESDPMETLREMNNKTVADYNNIIARMGKYPQIIDEYVSLLSEGVRMNQTMHKVIFIKHIPRIKKVGTSKVEKNPYFKYFLKQPSGIPDKQWKVLVASAKNIITKHLQPSYIRLAKYMQTTYLPKSRPKIALSSVPNGKNLYKDLLKYYTTTNLTALQIHQIGLKEVKRITERMEHVKKSVNFNGTLNQFRHYLRTSKKFGFKDGKSIVHYFNNLRAKVKKLLPRYFTVLPKKDFMIKKVPTNLAASQPAAYYSSPTYKKGGTFYINTYNPERRRRYLGHALFLHEAIPGHHLQTALQYEHHVPEFRRYTGNGAAYWQAPATYAMNTAYVEGWALYCEYLGEEMGMYTDPYDLFGRLSMEMLRACRLVVDTGMHMFGWSRQKAIDYLRLNTADDLADIVSEIDRYIGNPGQSCAYKIGEMEIRKLRKMVVTKLGAKFDLRKFHDFIMSLGPVPLTILKEQMDLFIKKQKSKG